MSSITMNLVIYVFSMDTTVCTNVTPEKQIPLKAFNIWDGGIPKKDILYIVNREKLMDEPGIWRGKHVLTLGKLTEEEAPLGLYWICLSESLSYTEVFLYIQSIFRGHIEWQLSLANDLLQPKSLDQILNTFEQTYNIHACIATESMKIIGKSVEFESFNDWATPDGLVDLRTVTTMVTDSDFQMARDKDKVFIYEDIEGRLFYCYNLHAKGIYHARIIANSPLKTQPCNGIMELVDYLGQSLDRVYASIYYQKKDQENELLLGDMINKMLSGIKIKPGDLRFNLETRNWHTDHRYQMLLFRFQKGASGGVGMSYYRTQIESLLQECFVLEKDGSFICIQNLSLMTRKPDYEHTLPYFLRETLCKAGISSEFSDFARLHEYYLEAEMAFSTGEKTDPTKWYYHFRDYALSYILEQCVHELGRDQVSHPAISVLREYDLTNDTELEKTLKIYLQEKHNVSHTAQKMMIHRTTLLFRLERIRKLTGIDPDDYRTALHLMISFALPEH